MLVCGNVLHLCLTPFLHGPYPEQSVVVSRLLKFKEHSFSSTDAIGGN